MSSLVVSEAAYLVLSDRPVIATVATAENWQTFPTDGNTKATLFRYLQTIAEHGVQASRTQRASSLDGGAIDSRKILSPVAHPRQFDKGVGRC
jgi:hypothetical protein